MKLESLRHVAIEGAIGAGKTSLARRLAAHLRAELLLERPEDNPFLARYYEDGSRYALQTQLFFLFQRLEQTRVLAEPGMFGRTVVSDFLFDKDALFASLTLGPDEHRLYTQVHAQIAPRLPAPDLVVWLQADVPTLLERIRRRGIAMEQGLEAPALERLTQAYARHFGPDFAAPLLAVETAAFHPAARDEDFERLLRRLEAFRGPREAWAPGEPTLLPEP